MTYQSVEVMRSIDEAPSGDAVHKAVDKDKNALRQEGAIKIVLDTSALIAWMMISTGLVFHNKVCPRVMRRNTFDCAS